MDEGVVRGEFIVCMPLASLDPLNVNLRDVVGVICTWRGNSCGFVVSSLKCDINQWSFAWKR